MDRRSFLGLVPAALVASKFSSAAEPIGTHKSLYFLSPEETRLLIPAFHFDNPVVLNDGDTLEVTMTFKASDY